MKGDRAITGGLLVTAGETVLADVLITGGRVSAIGSAREWSVGERIDADGCYVTPGGVDVHTHFEEWMGPNQRTADTFFEGTRAAAYGGTTTVIGFAKAQRGLALAASAADQLERAAATAAVDFGFHATIDRTGLTDGVRDDLLELTRQGMSSWKFFTAYPDAMMVDDRTLLEGFALAAEVGALPLVHAENGAIVESETQRLLAEGAVDEYLAADAHPAEAEREAIQRVIVLANFAQAPLYIVHVSSAVGAEVIRRARRLGRRVWGETCPHYLVRAYEDYAHPGFEAAKSICSPPIRERSNQAPLWQALADGTLSTVGTDHASYLFEDAADLPPQKPRGRGCFAKVPVGVPGVEDRLALLLEAGVRAGKLTLQRFVDVTATSPAKLFGLYPRKGTIAVGGDADLVVWDFDQPRLLGASSHHMRSDYNLYEGIRVSPTAREVLLRGETIVRDGAFHGSPGSGRYIERRGLMPA
jgi:dihydropyrimidinase